MKPFVTRFHVPLYKTVVDVVFGDDLKVCHAHVHRDLRMCPADIDNARALTYPVINGHSAITFNVAYESRIQNAIGHEAFHMTMGIMDYIGIRHTRKTEEPFAYLHGALLEQLNAAYDKFRKHKTQKET